MYKTLNIHAVKHGEDKNRFCGPSVISSVTGVTTGEAARLIRKQTGARKVTGTYTGEVLNALAQFGIGYQRVQLPTDIKNPTLAAWLRSTVKKRTSNRVFLVSAGHHWQLIQGRRYVCGIVGNVISIKDKKVKRRARVRGVWELTLLGEALKKPSYDISKPKPTKLPKRANKAKLECQKIARENQRIVLDKENADGWITYWVFTSFDTSIDEQKYDPWHNDSHVVDHLDDGSHWFEIRDRMREYKKILAKYDQGKAVIAA